MMKRRSMIVVLSCLAAACLAWAATAASSATIVVIGDSTVSTYKASQYPWTGWGQVLALYFKKGSVTVINHAVGGRSSRSFVTLGQWAGTVPDLKKGDWLFIQFGHNDRDYTDTTRYTDTAAYKQYLGMYIDSARKLGVHPVLVTPMNMNTWTDTAKRAVREVFTEGANNYWGAMKHVGLAKNVPVLDLGHQSTLLMDTMGQGYMAKFHFMGLDTGEYANYPTGNADGTHFQEEGAQENARMIAVEIARQSTDSVLAPLAALLAQRYTSTVSVNLASGGTITHSRVFPPGATATIKVEVATGKTFRYWADSKGDSMAKATLLTYMQDTLPHTYIAVFAGATGVLPRWRPVPAGPRIRDVSVRGGRWAVRWADTSEGASLRVVDLHGRISVPDRSVSGRDGVTEFVFQSHGVQLVELVHRGRVVDAKEIVP
jgi:lysophospholipase L1-like esterase